MMTFRGMTAALAALAFAASVAVPPHTGRTVSAADDAPAVEAGAEPVSYHSQIRPIFQARCQGCHQPAKSDGSYVMTDFARMLKGGESELPAVVAHKPDESYLLDLIVPVDGMAEMPKTGKPLAESEIELVRRWIAQGAEDDTPANALQRYDAEHPPVYTRPPVVTALDYAPDGSLLAVAGFHEVLLHKPEGGLVGRLVGLSERIESVKFSPDGKRLAVTGGLPARMGEVQVWDVASRDLLLSVPVTYDTVYGASWSPDGTRIAFGCADNTVRVIDAETGEQTLYQGSHNDWVFDTVFSKDGSHVVSVGRDRTAKLTEYETQRFIDNITSITPGALKGGIAAVDRHPERDEILVGGADGVPKIFRIFRTSKRVIGDNANLIREFPALDGRIFDVDVSADGKRIAAGSSLNGQGKVHVYAYEFDTDLPDDLKKIVAKRSYQRSKAEQEKLAQFRREGVSLLAETSIDDSGIYAVAFSPDGTTVAASGSNGRIHLIDTTTGEIRSAFLPIEITPDTQGDQARAITWNEPAVPDESLPESAELVELSTVPAQVELRSKFDTVQLLVNGRLATGDVIDVTRTVQGALSQPLVQVTRSGLVQPLAAGTGHLTLTLAGVSTTIPITVSGLDQDFHPDFIRDVNPVLSKLGCNQGTCHGAKDGKAGFKLSLRGYDPLFDTRAFTDDLASRRTNMASPDDSLMLLKATGAVPHTGGQLTRVGEPAYELIRQWLADGAPLNLDTPRVSAIRLEPENPIVQKLGSRQQMRVVATYEDGTVRDVTSLAFIESGATDIAVATSKGLITVLRRGEAPVLARFEGAYAATIVTAMGDRSGFVWEEPAANNHIDELVARKLERMKTLPSELCTDAEFIRRIYLDLTGLPPTADEVRAFLADDRDSREKRDALIDSLVGSDAYVDLWTNKWADLLQVNRKYLGAEGAVAFRDWIRKQVAENTPYNKFAYEILTADGSNKQNPAASYYKILRTPDEMMENTTHLFLAVRFNCNKCHDHPFERWTQDQYYETAAFFARVGLKKDPESGDKEIGRTAVEAGKPLFEIIYDKESGEVTHERTGQVTTPEFPYACDFEAPQEATRREQLARWITSRDNRYFATSYVNRMWGYLLGRGLIEPLDDIRAGNPPTNPALLSWLTEQFIQSGFDTRELVRLICKSRTYQRSIRTNQWNEDDTINYSHAIARRLPAEVIYDALHAVTGSVSKLPGVPPGTRAAQLPDAGVTLPSGFLANFGRPARESACECERSSGVQLGPIMAMVSGPTVGDAISDPNNAVAKLVAEQPDNAEVVKELFLRILNRPASDREIAASLDALQTLDEDHERLQQELAEYRKFLQPITQQKEQQRQERIAVASRNLEDYKAEIAPREAELDRQQAERTAKLEAELKAYEDALPEQLAKWEAEQANATNWVTLEAKTLETTNGATLTQEDDKSIVASGENGKGVYTITAETDLPNISGVRIELLADDRFPQKGPGRAPDGNYVLTEFELSAASLETPDQGQKVELQNAKADFSQQGYDVKTAIDGQMAAAGNGWATAPRFGQNRYASFELKQPLGDASGSLLTFKLHQLFQSGQHSIGRMRIAVTNSPQIELQGHPETVWAILAVKPEERSAEQQTKLLEYFRSIDPELKKKQQAVADSKKPRPIDPKLKTLQERLERVQQPLPPDPKLADLQRAVELSSTQLEHRRLTWAQDLSWALINSPAFLFNH